MGQSLLKLSPGNDTKRMDEIIRIIEKQYTKHFGKNSDEQTTTSLAYFYRAVCETAEEINKTFHNTQLKVPRAEDVKMAFEIHHKQSKGPVTRAEFQALLREILTMSPGFTGFGAKDTLMYIFGVPLTALLVKQGLFPRVVRNEFFIPAVTSATVFTLAKLNKI